MRKVKSMLCLLVVVMCFVSLEVEATRNRTRNPNNKRLRRRTEQKTKQKMKLEEKQRELRAKKFEEKEIENEKIRQATLKTWDDKKRITPKPTADEKSRLKRLGPGGLAEWVMARKSEILMGMPKYGTAERWKFDLKRMPSLNKIFSKATGAPASTVGYRSWAMRIAHRGARSTPRWVILREWGIPDNVKVLTTKGEWVGWWGISKENTPHYTNRERWIYKYFVHDEALVFTNGKLKSWHRENEKTVKIGMPRWVVLHKWGTPNDINRSVFSWGVHEQWVYGDTYLYFEDGILTSFQE